MVYLSAGLEEVLDVVVGRVPRETTEIDLRVLLALGLNRRNAGGRQCTGLNQKPNEDVEVERKGVG